MKSALYRGSVVHRRSEPVEHSFRMRLSMLYLDLEELPRVFDGRWLWSVERRNVAAFHRRDHLGDPARPLDACVRDLVEARTGARPEGPVRLLTHLRYWGYCFNPVSFYYLFDARDERVETVVADVTNTPWGERHAYVLGRDGSRRASARGVGAERRKIFHVSPFMGMDVRHRFALSEPGPRLRVAIANRRDDDEGAPFFHATLDLERRPLSGPELARALLAHPFPTGAVIAGIYRQAWRLRRKGVPVHPHPAAGAAAAPQATEIPGA